MQGKTLYQRSSEHTFILFETDFTVQTQDTAAFVLRIGELCAHGSIDTELLTKRPLRLQHDQNNGGEFAKLKFKRVHKARLLEMRDVVAEVDYLLKLITRKIDDLRAIKRLVEACGQLRTKFTRSVPARR